MEGGGIELGPPVPKQGLEAELEGVEPFQAREVEFRRSVVRWPLKAAPR